MAFKRKRGSAPSTSRKRAKHLSSTEKEDVKKIVRRNTAKSLAHNGPIPIPPISGLVPTLPTGVVAFTAINQGLNEYNRRGDSIYIDKIRFRAYVTTSTSNEAVRLTVLRQPRSGFPPVPINGSLVWQNYTAGAGSIISAFQDDQPCQVLYDKKFTLGIAAGMQESRVIEFTLNFTKRPLRCVYLDNTVGGSPSNTVMGDIELFVCSSNGTANMTYTYDVTFHEK